MNHTQHNDLIESVDAINQASEDLETMLAHNGYGELLDQLVEVMRNTIKNAAELQDATDRDIEEVIDGILQEGHVGRLHHTIKEAQKELSFASDTVDRVRDEIERDQWLASMDAAVQATQATLHA